MSTLQIEECFWRWSLSLWFSHHENSTFTRSDPRYTELFRSQVVSLRKRYGLIKTDVLGEEIGTNPPLLHISKKGNAYAVVEKLLWRENLLFSGWPMQPELVFKIYLQVWDDKEGKIGALAFGGWVTIVFPQNYPFLRPQVLVCAEYSKRSYVLDQRRLCIMAKTGDWRVTHNVCRAVETTVIWAIYTYKH